MERDALVVSQCTGGIRRVTCSRQLQGRPTLNSALTSKTLGKGWTNPVRTGGLQADDVEAAVRGPRLRGQHPLDLLPHGQHQPRHQQQLAHARARTGPPRARRLIRVRPGALRARGLTRWYLRARVDAN